MPLPPLVRQHAEMKLCAFCEARVPPAVRHAIRLTHKVRGNVITLIEERPHFRENHRTMQNPIAQFRYSPTFHAWRLFWRDRDTKWHPYVGSVPSKTLVPLLAEVNADPTCIFWG